jgi:flagellar basal body-associated protein FliL
MDSGWVALVLIGLVVICVIVAMIFWNIRNSNAFIANVRPREEKNATSVNSPSSYPLRPPS